ncbi:LuxR C-terminal-related transcriptional regulator [Micromonospora sp. CPCC 206061]|uniref:LuxR C-terminal-related transcriptional regulator n=1 Tax=Micromonospora sp. CPCC 206061 TaxID=3122410 RepID=UPI002FEEAC42
MGVVDDLLRARAAYDRREWLAAYGGLSQASGDSLGADDFTRLATAAYLVGQRNDCVQALQRAYQLHIDTGDVTAAVRVAFWLALVLLTSGEAAVGGGWIGRAERLLTDVPGDVVERGYVLIHVMFRHIFTGDFGTALELAQQVADYGRRFTDPDLVAMGLVSQGRILLYGGHVPEGLALLDEAMVGVAAGEVSTIFAGNVYCTMIEGCQEIADFDRAARWTSALTAWCDEQHGMVAFTGQCAVHRGQIMRAQGAFDEALTEFDLAVRRYRQADTMDAAGLAMTERGDVLRLRGGLDAAATAYEQASAFGHEPQPGLALLWLAQGRVAAAVAAVRRTLSEAGDPVHRSRLLPAAVEILLVAGHHDEAAGLADELRSIAAAFGCPSVQARADHACAAAALAAQDPAAALPLLRRERAVWERLGARYDTARCRVLLGRCLHALGDHQSALAELAAARRAFADLGAKPAEDEVAALIHPTLPRGLTEREVEVLRLVAAGKTNPEIAKQLVLSEKTVGRHLSNIFAKIDVTTRTAAAAFAFEHRLV